MVRASGVVTGRRGRRFARGLAPRLRGGGGPSSRLIQPRWFAIIQTTAAGATRIDCREVRYFRAVVPSEKIASGNASLNRAHAFQTALSETCFELRRL